MKILLLDHPQFTHGTWMLYEGIVRIFGRDCITVFPPKPCFYDSNAIKLRLMDIRWYREVYKNLNNLPVGVPALSPGEILTYNDERVVDYTNVILPSPDKSYQDSLDEDELISLINNNYYDFIILGNSHRVPTIALARLRDRCKSLPPIIYCDFGERDEFNAHWWHVFKPALVFKQILTPELLELKGSPAVPCDMFPLPLSNPRLLLDEGPLSKNKNFLRKRKIDVISSFGPTWPTRQFVQDRVKEVCSQLDSKSSSFKSVLDGYKFDMLSKAKICVSMRGSGRDTERYWEFPAHGAAMICDGTMGCIHPFPFQDKLNAVFYRNLNELESSIHYLLGDEENRLIIARNGYNHIRKYHSIEARALFFLGIIDNRIGINYDNDQLFKLNSILSKLEWDSRLPNWSGPVVGYDE